MRATMWITRLLLLFSFLVCSNGQDTGPDDSKNATTTETSKPNSTQTTVAPISIQTTPSTPESKTEPTTATTQKAETAATVSVSAQTTKPDPTTVPTSAPAITAVPPTTINSAADASIAPPTTKVIPSAPTSNIDNPTTTTLKPAEGPLDKTTGTTQSVTTKGTNIPGKNQPTTSGTSPPSSTAASGAPTSDKQPTSSTLNPNESIPNPTPPPTVSHSTADKTTGTVITQTIPTKPSDSIDSTESIDSTKPSVSSPINTINPTTSITTDPIKTTTKAPEQKTFSYSLNNGQEEGENKHLMEVCKKLMVNMQDGNCSLKWEEREGKKQIVGVEIHSIGKTTLANQYLDEVSKSTQDNRTLIAILASCGALLIMIIILAVCASHHRKPYNENQQHLTEELHTVENGYHDNPTLEVMEVQPEMQEKKVALNGEFNDSWIVPIDNLLKEDIPDEEDTHL